MSTKRNWTQRRRRAAEEWVDEAKKMLALADWTIEFNWSGNEHTHPLTGEYPSAVATITPAPSSKHAVMCLSRELLDLDSEDQRQVLTHELVHCHLFAIHEYGKDAMATVVEENALALKLHGQALNQHIETATDALADAFAPFMPSVCLV